MARLKVLPQEKVEVKLVPSGFFSVTVTQLNVLLATLTVTCWLAAPVNVRLEICPGVVRLTLMAGALIVSVPVVSVTL